MGKDRIIKKYQNRKLYDVQESRYVTLTELAGFIGEGDRIRVVDNVTSTDLTPIILTEILLELEKENQEEIPLTLLKEIIKNGEGSIYKFIQRFVIGLPDSHLTNISEMRDFIVKMEEHTEITSVERDDLLNILNERYTNLAQSVENRIEENIAKALNKVKKIYKLQRDIQKLKTKAVSLEKIVDRLENA